MAGPWEDFYNAVSEGDSLPPVKIGGEKFTFPASPPAIFTYRMVALAEEYGDSIPDQKVFDLMGEMVGKETLERIMALTTTSQFGALINSLMSAWMPTEQAPNRKARRARQPKTTSKRSSAATGRSKPTSTASTG